MTKFRILSNYDIMDSLNTLFTDNGIVNKVMYKQINEHTNSVYTKSGTKKGTYIEKKCYSTEREYVIATTSPRSQKG